MLRDDIEYVVHCEEDGTVIGPLSKVHAHLQGVRQILTHYSTRSMVYNPDLGKFGIQLTNPNKVNSLKKGLWDMGVAGHNCYETDSNGHLTYIDFARNLQKEAYEEIGMELLVKDNKEEFVDQVNQLTDKSSVGYIFETFLYKTERNNEFVGMGLIYTSLVEFNFIDDEVVDFQWLTEEEIESFMLDETKYAPAMKIAYDKTLKFMYDNKLI